MIFVYAIVDYNVQCKMNFERHRSNDALFYIIFYLLSGVKRINVF